MISCSKNDQVPVVLMFMRALRWQDTKLNIKQEQYKKKKGKKRKQWLWRNESENPLQLNQVFPTCLCQEVLLHPFNTSGPEQFQIKSHSEPVMVDRDNDKCTKLQQLLKASSLKRPNLSCWFSFFILPLCVIPNKEPLRLYVSRVDGIIGTQTTSYFVLISFRISWLCE